MANVKELRDKIAARKAQRAAEQKAKYAKMVAVAKKAPEKLEACLARLADKCAGQAEGWENLRENLGLVKASKEAPLKVRVAAARNYAKAFNRIALESPDKLAEALVEAYQGLNDIAADIELAADQMGVELEAAPMMEESVVIEAPNSFEGEEQGVAEDIIEEAEAEGEAPAEELEEKAEGEEEPEEEKEASGADAWVTDRDEAGQPKAPEQVDVPRVAAAGSDSFVTDRDKSGEPEAPAKLQIPQAQGAAPVKASKKKAEILQEVGGGHEAQPAEKFVKEIPQAEGASELNKAAAQLKPLVKKAMSRKDYIILADAIRSFKMPNHQREELAKHFSQTLKRDNHRFSEGIFVDYALGRGGARGGNKFKGDQPNVSEDLFV